MILEEFISLTSELLNVFNREITEDNKAMYINNFKTFRFNKISAGRYERAIEALKQRDRLPNWNTIAKECKALAPTTGCRLCQGGIVRRFRLEENGPWHRTNSIASAKKIATNIPHESGDNLTLFHEIEDQFCTCELGQYYNGFDESDIPDERKIYLPRRF